MQAHGLRGEREGAGAGEDLKDEGRQAQNKCMDEEKIGQEASVREWRGARKREPKGYVMRVCSCVRSLCR
eukprot:scaffold163102_cov22-Tisochrysis_lutea.AAC.2